MKAAIILCLFVVVFSESCGQKQNSKEFIKVTLPYVIQADEVRPPDTSDYVNVEDFLPVGYSVTGDVDYTDVLQKVLDKERNVIFPNFPVLVNYSGLSVRSYSNVIFPDKSLLKFKSSSKGSYTVLSIQEVKNINLYSPKIEGDRYRRLDPSLDDGEWGMGIRICSAQNINVYNPIVQKCWGDGIYIGTGKSIVNNNVLIKDAFIDDNRRNGVSIITGAKIQLVGGVYSNTAGTNPQAGIDIEPDNNDESLVDILLKNCRTINNGRIGIVISLGAMVGKKDKSVNILIENHIDEGSEYGFVLASLRKEVNSNFKKIDGTVYIKNPKWKFNRVPLDLGTTKQQFPKVIIENPEIYSQNKDVIDILKTRKLKSIKFDGDVSFVQKHLKIKCFLGQEK